MTGTKAARIRKCVGHGITPCPYWRSNGGWDGPRCFFGREEALAVAWHLSQRGDGAGCIEAVKEAAAATPMSLDDATYEGPASNCPAGFWADLKPADLEAEAAADVQRGAEGFLHSLAPVLAKVTNEELVSSLAEMVKARQMNVAVAEKIVELKGIALDKAV